MDSRPLHSPSHLPRLRTLEDQALEYLIYRHEHVAEFVMVKKVRDLMVSVSFDKVFLNSCSLSYCLKAKISSSLPPGVVAVMVCADADAADAAPVNPAAADHWIVVQELKDNLFDTSKYIGAVLDHVICGVRSMGRFTRKEIEQKYNTWTIREHAPMYDHREQSLLSVIPSSTDGPSQPSGFRGVGARPWAALRRSMHHIDTLDTQD